MNNKTKGALQILLVVVLIAAFAYVAVAGIGGAHKGKAQNIRLGLDLKGGVSVTYQANKANPTDQEMDDTVYKMQKRVEDVSTEAAVYKEGSNRITIDIPGVSNSAEILKKLGNAGSLQFIMYSDLKAKNGGTSPAEGDEVTFDKKNVKLDGSMIKEAKAATEQDQSTGATENVVEVTFNSKGSKKFGEITEANVGSQMAIVYDNKLVSAPTIKSAITEGKCTISGGFEKFSEAEELASTLRIGALPLELTNIHDNVVGATLGSEALRTSLIAGVIGLILVILFMIVMYRLPGVASSIALIFYVGAMLLILNGLNVTLTLPGIAGIVLSIGMAVDANCIIFTRIREELASGKTVASSIKIGFSKALSAIIDGNITTLIAAFVLYLKGSGTVKGFAYTLMIGIILSLFTAMVVTRYILYSLYALGLKSEKLYGRAKERKSIDFIGKKAVFFTISGIIIAAGLISMGVHSATEGKALNYGLDFMGGTSTTADFGKDMTIEDIENDIVPYVEKVTGDSDVQATKVEGTTQVTIKTRTLSLDERQELEDTLAENCDVDASTITSQSISSTISGEMRSDALKAVIVSCIFMLLYIWFRFKDIRFAASAILALVHDVLVVITVYALVRISVGSTFIACVLTIVGYSINDTIVIFDRIRENLALKTGKQTAEDLREIANKSLTQTLSRSINTSITTFIMVVMLYILGVASIRDFSLPLMAGLVCGAYSSICIATELWYVMKVHLGKNKATK